MKCANSGTELEKSVTNANSSINENSLVIIFTDDGGSRNEVVGEMKNRTDVFWQIIVYDSYDCISSAISGISNISLVSMTYYASKDEFEIAQALLKDYIDWKKQKYSI